MVKNSIKGFPMSIMEQKLKTGFMISLFIFFNSCGFTPECRKPKPGDLSYPVDGIIVGDKLFVLNSDENFEHCSSFISVFRIEGYNLTPIKIILPQKYEDFTLAGRLISFNGKIFVTERGKGMIFVFAEDGEVIDLYEEGGNPYGILFVEQEGKNTIITANIKSNTITLYTEKLERLRSILYPYPPISMVYDENSKRLFVGFSGSSDVGVINFDATGEDYLKSEVFSISPDGNISYIKHLSIYEGGMYVVMESPYSLLFVNTILPLSSRLLYLFKERIFSVDIIKEKNLLLAISPFGDMIYGFSLNPFLLMWKIGVKGNPVKAIYSPKTGLVYIIPMMEKKVKILNPETLELR